MYQILKKNKKGFVLIIILIIILLIGVMTPVLITSTEINLKLATNIAVNKKVIYAARAGIEYGKCIIIEGGEIPTGKKIINLNNDSFFAMGISEGDDDEEYVINSTGFYQGKKEKLSKNIKIN